MPDLIHEGLKESLTHNPSGPIRLIGPSILAQLRSLVTSTSRAEWDSVYLLSTQLYGCGLANLGLQAKVLEEEFSLRQRIAINVEDTGTLFDNLMKRDLAKSFVDRSRAVLEARDPDLFERVSSTLNQLEAGSLDISGIMDRSRKLRDAAASSAAMQIAELAIAASCRGLLGILHYTFNSVYESYTPNVETADQMISCFALLLEDSRCLLRCSQGLIYTTALSESVESILPENCQHVIITAEDILHSLVPAQARALSLANLLQEHGKNTEAEKVGRLLTKAAFLTRETIASHVSAQALRLESCRRDSSRIELIKDARKKAFDCDVPNGRNTELSKLSDQPGGSFVEIGGFIQSMEQARIGGKLVGRLRLIDPSNGAEANVGILFVNPAHVGLTVGAYVSANGKYEVSSELIDGQPGVECDRLSLAKLSEKSWRIQFLTRATRWYEVWRNGSNLYWSIGPHKFVDGDESAPRGASEIIFLKYVRPRP